MNLQLKEFLSVFMVLKSGICPAPKTTLLESQVLHRQMKYKKIDANTFQHPTAPSIKSIIKSRSSSHTTHILVNPMPVIKFFLMTL